ncbi:MAG: DNA recombination protein RmuC [Bdellovibrionota bacterium]
MSESLFFAIGTVFGSLLAGGAIYYVMNSRYKMLEAFQNKSESTRDQLESTFENLALKILEEKTANVQNQSIQNLQLVLTPLKERMQEFEKRIHEARQSDQTDRHLLRGEIGKLVELNFVMSKETQQLTRALKSEVKTQGIWGEMILENILERSGLRKDEEFVLQSAEMNLKNDNGEKLIPDVIIKVPGERHIIVDSKMTLLSFEAYINAENDEKKAASGQLFIRSLEAHINGLAAKEYHLADKLVSPDFVILFIPLEPAFALAFQLKPEIFNTAWNKSIAVVSPTTLLTTLRTVASIWKQEKQTKNAMEIAKRGGLLFDKFSTLLADIKFLGDRLDGAQKSYTEVIKKISEGRGNLISQVEELKELGAKTEKNLPQIGE